MDSKDKEERIVDVTDEPEEEEIKSFLDRAHDLVLSLIKVDGYKKHPGMVNFCKRLEETMTKLDPNDKDNEKIIERNLRREEKFQEVFEEFYMKGRKTLLKGTLAFLLNTDIKIVIGTSGETHLPIGEIYTKLEQEDPGKVVNIEASVFFLSQYLCPDEDLNAISEICDEFKEAEPSKTGGNILDMIGNVVDKASAKFTKYGSRMEGPDGKFNRDLIAEITYDMMDDDEITTPFQEMISQVGGEDFDINEVKEQIMGKTTRKK